MKHAVLGIVIKENKILVIKRKKVEENLVWAFPGGKVEENESYNDSVIREVIEETGIHCKVIKKIGSRKHPKLELMIHYYACEYRSGELIACQSEVEVVSWINKEEMLLLFTDIYPPVLQYIAKKIV